MSKNNKVEERAIEVEKGTPLEEVVAQVKKMSGFDAALPIRANLADNNQVEWEFLVGDYDATLKSELMTRMLTAAQKNQ